MKKELLKKLQLGLISFSALGLLAACGTGDTEDPALDDDPAIEEPADEEDEADVDVDVDEDEEDEN